MPRLELADGQWIDVKDKLKVRDKREIHTYAVEGYSTDGQTYRFNIVKRHMATAAAKIRNWLVKGEDGKPIAWPTGQPFKERIAVIDSLDEDTFDQITVALITHDEALTKEEVQEKKDTPIGETNSETSSPSANT